jgi:hypothetical protein
VRSSNAKKVSIMAISAALYASLFGLSFVVTLPGFTLLYLPIILLGVFPIWFGWSGLVGSMIGALIGGIFVENLAWFAWVEMITTLIIYGLNWLLLNRKAVEAKTKVGLLSLLGVYAFTLFVGLGYILWQETFFPKLWLPEDVIPVLVPTFALNFVIAVLICPALVRTISPKMRNWGMYYGTFWERRTQTAKASKEH